MRRDGSKKHRLLAQEFADGFPDWQPSLAGWGGWVAVGGGGSR